MIDTFSCAVLNKIHLAGTLYVTNKGLYFYSSFNNKTLLFGSTRISIPFHEVYRAELTGSMLLLNKSIKVFRVEEEPIVFMNFLFRDACFKTIVTQLQVFRERRAELMQFATPTIDEGVPQEEDSEEVKLHIVAKTESPESLREIDEGSEDYQGDQTAECQFKSDLPTSFRDAASQVKR